ncbi:hypothetical protein KO507_04185 [Gilvimarinus agarilyticus]|uniref:hypothetical protein n=1 Tax=Gilvimarinus sp. 2_MG-2023 TaxID=3062666 RepID=UPI001C08D3CF|nr:hypothetical protein [Gilvimarinus sp. 2_MG-2023]MBU2884964.1 hypothetical protein [Gilvimarinus agarilyticus]MDO6569862.1 hypothetical protein [Gilvimarinus sp. 2_MG-2023]
MMKLSLVLIVLLSGLSATSVLADFGPRDYVMFKEKKNGVMPKSPTIVPEWGSPWVGKIVFEEPMYYTFTHELIFELESPDYFTNMGRSGHFAIAVRATTINPDPEAETDSLQGRGIIIGKMDGYPQNHPCGPTSSENSTIAIEMFYHKGTCVYGPSTETVVLHDNVRYRVQLASQYFSHWTRPTGNKIRTHIRYKLWKKVAGSWVFVTEKSVVEEVEGIHYKAGGHVPGDRDSAPPLDSQGIFFGEVQSEHEWTMYIYNMASNTCNLNNSYCTNL